MLRGGGIRAPHAARRFVRPVNPILGISRPWCGLDRRRAPSLVVRFSGFIADLRDAAADCGGRRLLAGPLTIWLRGRLGRIALAFSPR